MLAENRPASDDPRAPQTLSPTPRPDEGDAADSAGEASRGSPSDIAAPSARVSPAEAGSPTESASETEASGYVVHPPSVEKPTPPVLAVMVVRETLGEKPHNPIGLGHMLGLLCFESVVFGSVRLIGPAPVAFVVGAAGFILLPILEYRGAGRAFYAWTLLLTYLVVAIAAVAMGSGTG
ncbi:MAG TPA: hypothetical protein VGE52_07720 [Pirellulales bacterium]